MPGFQNFGTGLTDGKTNGPNQLFFGSPGVLPVFNLQFSQRTKWMILSKLFTIIHGKIKKNGTFEQMEFSPLTNIPSIPYHPVFSFATCGMVDSSMAAGLGFGGSRCENRSQEWKGSGSWNGGRGTFRR